VNLGISTRRFSYIRGNDVGDNARRHSIPVSALEYRPPEVEFLLVGITLRIHPDHYYRRAGRRASEENTLKSLRCFLIWSGIRESGRPKTYKSALMQLVSYALSFGAWVTRRPRTPLCIVALWGGRP
jgi:hypothetical protein